MTDQNNILRNSIVFYRSFYEAVKEIPDNNQLEVYNAIFELAFNFNEVELFGLSKTIFTLIKPQIKANNAKFENGKRGADHGKKGGRPTKEITPKKPQNNPSGVYENNPKLTPNVVMSNVECSNVNDNVVMSNIKTIINHTEKKYNKKITDKSVLKNLKQIFKDGYTVEDIKLVIDFVMNDRWYQENHFDNLATISRPTKFSEKLERAKSAALKFGTMIDNSTNLNFL